MASLQEQGAYAYDGLGQRVKRTTTIRGSSETTVYVYDAFGRLAAEYSSVAPEAGTGGTFYRTEDHLGSTRLVTKQDQTVAECRDFFPFGERIGSGLNGRSADCYGGTSGAVKQQFTGKERDAESSLDYFGARYYSARLGRFIGPDEPLTDQFASDPQSWNLYSYVRNNPLRFLDPTGRKCVETDDGNVADDGDGEMCQAVVKEVPLDPPLPLEVAQAFRWVGDSSGNFVTGFATVSLAAGAAAGAGMALATSFGFTTAGTVTRGMTTLGPLQFDLTNKAVGAIIKWGTGQAGAAITRRQAQNLTRATVQVMKRRGLTRRAVKDLLRKYEAALAEGGAKAANTQLVPRIKLMKRILDLW